MKIKNLKDTNYKILVILIFLTIVGCKINENTDEFNALITEEYNNCSLKDDCIIDLNKVFSFEWDEMYVFSMNHYPEAGRKEISSIVNVKYQGKREFLENRSILFINDNKIVHEVLTYYEPEGYIDTKPMFVEFTYGEKFPNKFTNDNAKFKLTKYINSKGYILEYLDNGAD